MPHGNATNVTSGPRSTPVLWRGHPVTMTGGASVHQGNAQSLLGVQGNGGVPVAATMNSRGASTLGLPGGSGPPGGSPGGHFPGGSGGSGGHFPGESGGSGGGSGVGGELPGGGSGGGRGGEKAWVGGLV